MGCRSRLSDFQALPTTTIPWLHSGSFGVQFRDTEDPRTRAEGKILNWPYDLTTFC